MKSPFPGMDPYLEKHWQDVHQALCTYCRDQLQGRLGGGQLVARLGERLVVESLFDPSRTIYPDARVVEYEPYGEPIDTGGGTAVAEMTTVQPIVIQVASDPRPEGFIEIIEPDSGRLVSVIEFLSPSNKNPGSSRRQYKQKQRELHDAQVNLVEIDLLRGGERSFLLPEAQIPPWAKSEYAVCVFRGVSPDRFEYYRIHLRERLPSIRIPLREQDRDIGLDLQSLIEMAYRNGRYDRTDYRQPCIPPLEGDDAAWAADLVRAQGSPGAAQPVGAQSPQTSG